MTDREEASGPPPSIKHSQRYVYIWLLQVVIVLISSSVVVWLVLIPKSPIYIITNVHIPALHGRNSTSHVHLSTSNGMNSTSHLIGNISIHLNLEFSNPNKKMGIYYNYIYITLYYSDAHIGSKSLPGFYQGYKNTTTYEVIVNADKQFLKGITDETTGLRVCLESAVKYKIFKSKTKGHQIYSEAYVPVGSNGRMLGDKNIKLHHMPKQTKN